MTSIKKLTVAVAMIISLLSLSVYAQAHDPELNHLSTPGISFNFPGGYTVADESTREAQKFVITRKGSSIQLTIVARRRWVTTEEYPAALEGFKEPIINNVVTALGLTNAAEGTAITSELGGSMQAEGVRLQSSGASKRTGDVIWLLMHNRLVGLALIRAEADEEDGMQLWEAVRSKLDPGVPPVRRGVTTIIGAPTGEMPATGARRALISGGVLNGKALELPKPVYPDIARAAHASGTVVVQVLIDEQGYVISAKAVSGHPLLQAASVAAAQQARFSPTRLEGQPVKVTGVIQYKFVAQ